MKSIFYFIASKKNLLFTLCLSLGCFFSSIQTANAQFKIGDNPGTIDPDAILEMESTNKGMILPRLATASRPPADGTNTGMMIYNIDESEVQYCDGVQWVGIGPLDLSSLSSLSETDLLLVLDSGGNLRTVSLTALRNSLGISYIAVSASTSSGVSGGNAAQLFPLLTNVSVDVAGTMAPGGSYYEIPETGMYTFSYSMNISSNGATGVETFLQVSSNGGATWGSVGGLYTSGAFTGSTNRAATATVTFNAGDRVRLWAYFCGGCPATSHSVNSATLTGTRVF